MNFLLKSTAACVGLLALSACEIPGMVGAPSLEAAPIVSALQVDPDGPRNFLYAHAMFGDPVFDRDVRTFERALTQGLGAPAQVRRFGYNDSALEEPTGAAVSNAIAELAGAAEDGVDTVVVMITTHGAPDRLAQKPAGQSPISSVSADALATFLEPLQADKQVIILQACYSGSLIDDLAGPNRIIMTAAAADRSSFGCNPDNDNTWYVKSLNQAIAAGGSWAQINARTVAGVRELEKNQGFGPEMFSNPQSYVGANMQSEWSGADS